MKLRLLFSLLLVVLLASIVSHASVQGWCQMCQCSGCSASYTDPPPAPPPYYPAGGFCICIVLGQHRCETSGLCTTWTTDPNYSIDCPGELNAKCCTNPYNCGGRCTGSSPALAYQVAHSQHSENPNAPVYLPDKLTLSRDELDKMMQTRDAEDVMRVHPSEHPWLKSKTFPDQIARLSPEMAAVLRVKVEEVRDGFGWSFPARDREGGMLEAVDGSDNHIRYQIDRSGSKWTFKAVIKMHDETKVQKVDLGVIGVTTLIVDGKSWTLSREDRAIADGKIE